LNKRELEKFVLKRIKELVVSYKRALDKRSSMADFYLKTIELNVLVGQIEDFCLDDYMGEGTNILE
jgi:hypothetical protein